jgi:hypothetical protein
MPAHAPAAPGGDVAPLLAERKRGQPVALISTEGFTAWHSAVGWDYHWVSRYPPYWA